MSSIIVNAQGTSSSSFSIGKRGVVIYQGSVTPSDTLGNDGDVFIKRGSQCNILIKNEGAWVAVGEIAANTPQYPYVASISADQTADFAEAEGFFMVDASASSVVLTLSSNIVVGGKKLTIKDSAGVTSSQSSSITIQTQNSELIDGQSSITIGANYSSISLISDGSNWYIT